MKKNLSLVSIALLGVLVLSSCRMPSQQATPSQTSAGDVMATQIAQTLTAISVEVLHGVNQTPVAENTLAASATPVPSDTPVQSVTPAIPTSIPIPCDRALFIADVSVADGTNFLPGTTFVKTWRLQNNGSCTWTSNYSLVFDSGNLLGGVTQVPLPGNVAPGQTVDLSISLVAPSTAGVYQGNWKLKNASGSKFGIGTDASKYFWVKILVGSTQYPVTGTVSGVCEILSTGPTYGAVFSPGDTFDSKWTVKNISNNTWTVSSVDFKFLGGTAFYDDNKPTFDLKAEVSPNNQIDLIVDSTAPTSPGLYTMTWGLVDGNSNLCTMSVTIRVK